MAELVDQFAALRGQIETAARGMTMKGVAKANRKRLARTLSEASLQMAEQAVKLAQRAEALAVENGNLQARLAQLEGGETTAEPII